VNDDSTFDDRGWEKLGSTKRRVGVSENTQYGLLGKKRLSGKTTSTKVCPGGRSRQPKKRTAHITNEVVPQHKGSLAFPSRQFVGREIPRFSAYDSGLAARPSTLENMLFFNFGLPAGAEIKEKGP